MQQLLPRHAVVAVEEDGSTNRAVRPKFVAADAIAGPVEPVEDDQVSGVVEALGEDVDTVAEEQVLAGLRIGHRNHARLVEGGVVVVWIELGGIGEEVMQADRPYAVGQQSSLP